MAEMLERENITKELSGLTSVVEDRQGSWWRKEKGQQQETAAAAENRLVGRPARSTDMHDMHRILGGRSGGRPKDPDCKGQTLC